MEFKTTPISRSRRRQTGMTLVEVMMASGIGGILAVMLVTTTMHTSRTVYSLTDSVGINSQSRYAIDRISQKIRQATNVSSFSPTALSVKVRGRTLTYTVANGTLIEVDNGQTNQLVADCKSVKFTIYRRNPLTNAFTQFPILTSTNEAKVVQMNWACSTTRVGKSAGVGEMYSARVVLRAK